MSMIPFGGENLTLLKRVETRKDRRTHVSYEKHLLTGCSWRMKSEWSRIDAEMRCTRVVVCRIPRQTVAPDVGDYLFRGDVNTDSDPAALLETYKSTGAFQIASVGDYTNPGMLPHYVARSE
jgi:hypothetical protein